MLVKFKKFHPKAKTPSYGHPGDVGLDLYSLEEKAMAPGEHYIFHLGFALEFDEGYGAFMMDKSGMAGKGLMVVGGVYDAGYRGEYSVQLVNRGDKIYNVEKGDKLAQLVILPVGIAELEEANELSETSRGTGRMGSTGKK